MGKKRQASHSRGYHKRCPNCGVILPYYSRSCTHCGASVSGQKIYVHGVNAQEVQEVSLALMEKAKPVHTPQSPWISGSFYLIVFLIVVVTLSVVGHLLPAYTLPIVLIGSILALSGVGAFQLRQDERLSEDNFLKLMALSFRYLPWLRRKEAIYDKSNQLQPTPPLKRK